MIYVTQSHPWYDNLSVKRQQLQTVSALAEREVRVRAHYARVGTRRKPASEEARPRRIR